MSCEKETARPERKAFCRKCRRDTNHRVIAQHDTMESDEEVGTAWLHDALLQCRGCGTISYEHSFEFTDNIDERGELYTTRQSYPLPDDELPEGVVVLLMTDIVNSTGLTEKLGDASFRVRANGLRQDLIRAIGFHDGKVAEGSVLGDGVLGVFRSAANALECAIQCVAKAEANELRLHVGVHAGDVMKGDNTVYGGAVNIAARIVQWAGADEILVSETARGLARTSTSMSFGEPRARKLKGIAEPFKLYPLRTEESWERIKDLEFE